MLCFSSVEHLRSYIEINLAFNMTACICFDIPILLIVLLVSGEFYKSQYFYFDF